jgi:hypothetical protein
MELQIPEYAKDAISLMSTHFKTKPATQVIPQLQLGNTVLNRMNGKKFICYGISPAPVGDERAIFIACNIDPQNSQFMLPGSLLQITNSITKTDKTVKYLGGFPYSPKSVSYAATHATMVVEAMDTGKITTCPIHNFTSVKSYVATFEEAMAAYIKCPLALRRKELKVANAQAACAVQTLAAPPASPLVTPPAPAAAAAAEEFVDDMSDTDTDGDSDSEVVQPAMDRMQHTERATSTACIQKKRKRVSRELHMVSHSTPRLESKQYKYAKILFDEIEDLRCRREIIDNDMNQRITKLHSIICG